MSVPVFDAEVAIRSENALGEGILWDERTQLLHWIDIDRAELHSYDVESNNYAVEAFPESEFVTALSPRKDSDGFIAAIEDKIVLVSPAKPTSPAPATGISAVRAQSTATVAEPLDAVVAAQHLVRFNDGASDAAGRFVIGSMRRPEIRDGKNWGQLFSVAPDGEVTTLLEDVGTSNGIDWSLDNKLMYYVDSGYGRIDVFDYDLATGAISNRRPFVDGHPDPLDGHTGGAFDGLVVDGVGNVWVARWGESRVIGYAPDGTMIAQIRTPGARSPTIPCFGGRDLSTMYIASASAGLAGASQDEWPESGNVLKIECGPGSEVAKVLGEGWKGRVRHRFGG